ncbi:MAG TPA: hypothetical protein VKD90_00460 [Gemmataceae bacterium]|nr:hypothetical protein [Gemmataceae bacterium]
MTKNAGRKGRWTQRDARTYTSALGPVVYRLDAWYARLEYQVREDSRDPGALPAWVAFDRWLGPYRRPRNAMVELEREATYLRNRHGADVRIGEEMESNVGPLPPG